MNKYILPKDRHHLDFDEYLKEKLKNPAFKAEFDRQQPEFAVIQAMIEARSKKKITQKNLAEKIGTKQSVISRLESGNANPSLNFLKKFAQALDTTLQIRFVKNS
ncbi:transcriptional regulator [Candidatus Roizmanbacteria bacterium RIFCSPHIGHO2_02_FULL_40_13b]|uniref:Transcriptional regulator n=1 Tax=Candidatus Roizmanbacteria bacterium RIFCSPHIGHO2_01_FULL_39_24 TaxID=1802032 RepID=A0A1F7GL77_9BACT|nr:MAG: transcriptional regulator [Candidatus Roizmanbacteria bacterium RIFCSPHIGHO2_01_FULL_39_24]OGK27969.1 MAG: transcriptional regulator [Candidatus Roizmanbacteria bacterium RIFCSPHIGHO2_02_FULL_40_13b]OGK49239.1 MAG: transcriptional regulator [Candidatus Roizmanbacteria bacterium RIFCSPLOWO2_01_FULL_40_32]OGK57207.1 MAG: transcriptional regulator [Candidatus Roizmanbacteria bacterium RIFCSPLOWO2_02_FULL_39_8]